eukprot:3274266-Pleurochrysis_carterae.AAC.1
MASRLTTSFLKTSRLLRAKLSTESRLTTTADDTPADDNPDDDKPSGGKPEDQLPIDQLSHDKPSGKMPRENEPKNEDVASRALFEKVIDSMAKQAIEFRLDADESNTDLVFFKGLVHMPWTKTQFVGRCVCYQAFLDTSGVLDEEHQGKSVLHVGQVVRDRATGHVLILCLSLKPLLGALCLFAP